MKKQLLLFQMDAERVGQITMITEGSDILVRALPASCHQIRIKDLLEWDPAQDEEEGLGEPLAQEMMIICQLENEELDELLQGFRQSPYEGVALKAILTPYNEQWTPAALAEELIREHAKMHRES